MAAQDNEPAAMEVDEQEEKKQQQPDNDTELSIGDLQEIWLRHILDGKAYRPHFDPTDEEHMTYLRRCAAGKDCGPTGSALITAAKHFEMMLMSTGLVDKWTAALIAGTYGTMGNLCRAWTAEKTREERAWLLYRMDDNSWVRCMELKYYDHSPELMADVLKELDEMKEFPISPELSETLYKALYED